MIPRFTMRQVLSEPDLLGNALVTPPLPAWRRLVSQSSWLVAGIVPGVERQPLKKLAADEIALLKLLHRWREEAEKGALEQLGVETVGLGAPVFTRALMPRALSQRASQKPSRPASKATAVRSILRPAFSASSRHRCSSFSNAISSAASFFNGWRSTPGTIPATSQLD